MCHPANHSLATETMSRSRRLYLAHITRAHHPIITLSYHSPISKAHRTALVISNNPIILAIMGRAWMMLLVAMKRVQGPTIDLLLSHARRSDTPKNPHTRIHGLAEFSLDAARLRSRAAVVVVASLVTRARKSHTQNVA